VTNQQGQVAWQWKYSAFGDERPTKAVNRFVDPAATPGMGSGTVADVTYNLRYPGQYADSESGLHYNYFRSYDTRVGRYTQPDPIGLDGGWNRFGYAQENALSTVDRFGLFGCGPGYKAISLGNRIWKCEPDGSDPNERQCATGECAAGVLPTRKPNPSSCEMECGAGSDDSIWRGGMCAVLSQIGKLGGIPGLPVTLTCRWADKNACIKKCEEDRKEKTCKPLPSD
jgi:RHS repeat-associated protein